MGKDMEKQAITLTLAPALHFSAMIEDKMQQAAKKNLQKNKKQPSVEWFVYVPPPLLQKVV